VILVTSSLTGEGKSTAAMALASSSASSGQSTVIVDCDLRRGTLSGTVGMPEAGLADALKGSMSGLGDVIVRGPVPRTYVIPAGSTMDNPIDLLTSPRMRDVITRLRADFDSVILDTPPVLTVVDALTLTAMVDKIVIIVEWNSTPRDAVGETLKLLRRDEQRIAGIVLNKVDFSRLGAYNKYGCYYGAVRTTTNSSVAYREAPP
jgi:polysaccharide biosynthesis transport protein